MWMDWEVARICLCVNIEVCDAADLALKICELASHREKLTTQGRIN